MLTGAVVSEGMHLTVQDNYICINCTDCDTAADTSDRTVYLANSINKTATCIDIDGSNVILDCSGYNISGDDSGTDYGVSITGGNNNTVQNCNFYGWGGSGVYVNNNLTTIQNNTFYHNSGGAVDLLKPYTNIYNNYFENSSDIIDILISVSNINVINNTFNYTNLVSSTKNGISIASAKKISSAQFENNKFYHLSYGINLGVSAGYTNENYTLKNNYFFNMTTAAIYIDGFGSNIMVENNTLDGNNRTPDCLYMDTPEGTFTNHTFSNNRFTNCLTDNVDTSIISVPCANINWINNSFDWKGNVDLNMNCTVYMVNNSINRTKLTTSNKPNSFIYLQWYIYVNATDADGLPLSNANISIYNSSSAFVGGGLTDASGMFGPINITEMVYTNLSTGVLETPHNVSLNRTSYKQNSTLVNLTQTGSVIVYLALASDIFPDLTLNNSHIAYPGGTIKHNDTFEINATIYNVGTNNATNANISFYVDTVLNQSRQINLTNGNSLLVQFNWTATGGNHTFDIKTDPQNGIYEFNETNNNATANISVKYVAVLSYSGPAGAFSRGKDAAGEDTLQEINNTLTPVAQIYDLFNSSHGMSANCSFYFNNTLIGTNLTNQSGYCSYVLDKTGYVAGNYNLTVNFSGLESDSVTHTAFYDNTSAINLFVISIALGTINHYDGLNYQIGEMAVMNITITRNDTAYSPEIVAAFIRGATDSADGPSVYSSTLYNDTTGGYRYASLVNSSPNGGSVRWRVRVNSTTEGLIGTASHSDITVNNNNGNLYVNAINSTGGNISNPNILVYDATGYTLVQSTSAVNNASIRKVKNHTLDLSVPSGERIYFDRINLNETINNVTSQIVSGYAGILPSGMKNITPIIAFESLSNTFVSANLTIPKNNKTVTSLLRCAQWNSTTANCTSGWIVQNFTFSENATHIWFNVSSFSGYAGGAGYNANLTIWDQNDSGMPFASQSAIVGQQIQFYTNYTNSTSGAAIGNASCNISFNASPNGPFNMSYNLTYAIYQYNRSFDNAGTYEWNATCGNTTYDILTARDNITVAAAFDASPYWQSNLTALVSTYSAETTSLFTIGWLDNLGISKVWLQSNYSGADVNYSMALASGTTTNGNYTYSVVLPAGSYYWISHANDTAGQWNNTIAWNFTIAPASSSVNLSINASNANISVVNGSAVNLNCTILSGQGNIYLYKNNTLINSGTALGNTTLFNSTGVYNITCIYNATQNYSSNYSSYWVNVVPDAYPYWQGNLTSVAATYSPSAVSVFNLTWADETGISAAWLESNYTGISANYSMNRVLGNSTNGTYNYSAVLPAGEFYWKSHANDTTNKINDTIAFNISVAKAGSVVNLTLNASNANQSLSYGNTIYLNCTKTAGEGRIYLFRNSTLINSGTSLLSNASQFNSLGLYNITCTYNQTQNYTANYSAYWVNVSDITAPYFDPLPVNITVEFGMALNYDINASDNLAVDSFSVNNSNFSINRSGVLINATNLQVGNYSMNITINDTSGNMNSTTFSVFVRDTTAPTFTYIANQSITYGSALGVQFNATDLSNLSTWSINDSTWFTINSSGYLRNTSLLNVTTYDLNVSVNDTYGNRNSSLVSIIVAAASSSSSSSSSSSGGGGGGGTTRGHSANYTNVNVTPSKSSTNITPAKPKSVPLQPVLSANESNLLPALEETKDVVGALVGRAFGKPGTISFWLKTISFVIVIMFIIVGFTVIIFGSSRRRISPYAKEYLNVPASPRNYVSDDAFSKVQQKIEKLADKPVTAIPSENGSKPAYMKSSYSSTKHGKDHLSAELKKIEEKLSRMK